MGNRFKVGDIVKGIDPRHYGITNTGMTKGRVEGLLGNGRIEVCVLEHPNRGYVGETYTVEPQYFELVSPSNPSRKFKVGDIIKGTPAANEHYSITSENMTRGQVTEVLPGGIILVKVLEHTRGHGGKLTFPVSEAFFELVEPSPTVESLQAEVDALKERVSALESTQTDADEASKAPTESPTPASKRLTKGDKVRIKGGAWTRSGDIGTIVEDDLSMFPYCVEFADGDRNWYEPHEVEAYTPAADVGAIVKVTKYSDEEYIGKVAKIINVDEDDAEQPIEVRFSDDYEAWPYAGNFEVVYESGTPEATALGTYMFQ